MRKDESRVSEWAKGTNNHKYGRRGVNKRVRKNVKYALKRDFQAGNP